MFNDFSLSDEEILKIIEEYKPLILSRSKINFKFDEDLDRKSTRLNSSHDRQSRMPSSA